MTRTSIPRSERGTVTSKPKGLDFARVAIAKALNPNSHEEQIRFAENRWGERSRATIATKAAVLPPGWEFDFAYNGGHDPNA
jgi:hypothetical protein